MIPNRQFPFPSHMNTTLKLSDLNLTSRGMQDLSVLLAPAHRKDKRRIPVCPEIIALRPAIKVHPKSRSFYLHNSAHADVGWMLWVNAF